jgi:hypothetical protein
MSGRGGVKINKILINFLALSGDFKHFCQAQSQLQLQLDLALFSLKPDKPRKLPDKPRKPPDKPRKPTDKPRKSCESLF